MKLCLHVLLLLPFLQQATTNGAGTVVPVVTPSPDISPQSAPPSSAPAHSLGVGEEACGPQVFSLEAKRAVGGAVERLGLQILRNLEIGPDQPNVIISPLSISLALAQLSLGARGDTEKLLLHSLEAHRVPCFHHTLGSLLQHLTNTSLQVASRLYLRPGFKVLHSFTEDSLQRYRSEPAPIVSLEEVNQWVSNATKGHMTNFLPELPANVVLMLINAVHFKGEWQSQFDPKSTSQGVFYVENRRSVRVDMMKSSRYPLSTYVDAELGAQVARFSFKGNTSFLVVKPLQGRGDVSSLVKRLNISELYRNLPQEEETVQVSMPKFNLQYNQELEKALTNMGLGSLFSVPDLSGISEAPPKVSSVRHASGVELSEEGVEASAATVIMSLRSFVAFSVNSPFLFAIVDHVSLAPLFLGVITNPAPGASVMQNDSPPGDDPNANRTRGTNETQRDSPRGGGGDTSDNLLSRNNFQSDEQRGENRSPCSAPSGGEGHGQPPNEVEGREDCSCPNPVHPLTV